jgi:hypothetical protein
MTIEFSQFVNGGVATEGDIVVGLRSGLNTRFAFPSVIGTTWNLITTNQTMVANNGYVVNSLGVITLTLPSVIVFGEAFEVTMMGSGSFIVQCATGQTIRVGDVVTSTSGSISSSSVGDSLRMLAISATQLQVLGGVTADFSIT